MAIRDVDAVPDCQDLYYVDTGMYDVAAYGAVYILDADRPAIVDTGIGTNHERILDALDEVGIARDDVAYILPTHVHLDHAGGAGFLADACPNAEVRTHVSGVPHLVDPSRLVAGTKQAVEAQWRYYVEPDPVPEDRISGLEDGDRLDLGDRTLDVVHAPGHAPHQVVFFDDGDDVCFTADAAGIWVPSVERITQTSPPPQFDLNQCLVDVERIVEREPSTLCFGHFGPRPFDEAVLDEYATVLTDWVDRVESVRTDLGDDNAVVDHFVETADFVDVWGERKARAEARMNVRGVLAFLDWRDSRA